MTLYSDLKMFAHSCFALSGWSDELCVSLATHRLSSGVRSQSGVVKVEIATSMKLSPWRSKSHFCTLRLTRRRRTTSKPARPNSSTKSTTYWSNWGSL